MDNNLPILIFDGNCGFCRLCVNILADQSKKPYDSISYQEWIPGNQNNKWKLKEENFQNAVYILLPDGTFKAGADCIYWFLYFQELKKWPYKFYEKFPPFHWASDLGYRFVANNRFLVSKLTKFFLRIGQIGHERNIVTDVFFFLIGLCYIFLFSSLSLESVPLFGEQGLASIAHKAERYKSFFGEDYLSNVYSIFWFSQKNAFLVFSAVLGIISGVFILSKRLRLFGLISGIILLLSFLSFGSPFMNFQWDTLLLETSFLSLLLVGKRRQSLYSGWAILALWSLAIKLNISSGLVKITASTPYWREGSALSAHFFSQPIANFVSFYFHQLPDFLLKGATYGVIAVQIICPLLLLIPGRVRRISVYTLISLQILIFMTGNYNFFNINTVALLLIFLKDKDLPFLPLAFNNRNRLKELTRELVRSPFAIFVIITNFAIIFETAGLVEKISPYYHPMNQRLRFFNRYGLFANMTMNRDEVILEGSYDNKNSTRIDFPFKPDYPEDCPGQIAPFHPRLDWQMWFAALGKIERNLWLIRLSNQILKNEGDGIKLLELPEKPYTYVKASRYRYIFNDFSNYIKGKCWKEFYKGEYLRTISLKDFN